MKCLFSILFLLLLFSGCKEKVTTLSDKPKAEKQPITEEAFGNLYVYYHSSPKTLEQKDENVLIEYAAEHEYTATRTPNGVYVVMLKEGSGEVIKWGDPIQANYKGYFLNGDVFDSSYKRNEPIKFRVGQMIQGWNEALMGRKKGDNFILLIPSHLGYGKRGMEGFVPPDANLIFEIEILDDK